MKKLLLLPLLIWMFTACGEAKEAVDITQSAFATAEAAGTAVANGELETNNNVETTVTESINTEPASETATDAPIVQNDANSGGDAGDVNTPTLIEAGLGLSGQLGNGDLWDFLRIRSEAHDIVTVTVTSAATNTEPIQFTLINSSGGSSTPVDILPGSSGTAVLAANQEQFNDIKLLSASANPHSYTLDILVQPENDADSGRDITAELGQALPITSGQVINGTSVARVNEGGHDNDCYAIDLPANAQLSVPVSSPVEQPYPESYASVEIYGPEGNYIWGATTSPGGIATLEHTVDATGGVHTLCATTFEYYPIGYYSFTPTVTLP